MAKGIPDPDYILRGQASPITALRFYTDAHNRQYLITGNQLGCINVWDLKTRQTLHTWEGHNSQAVLTIKLLHNTKLLSHGRDGFIHMWRLNKDGSVQADGCIMHNSHGFCPVITTAVNNQHVLVIPSQSTSVVDIIDIETKHKLNSLTPDSGPTGHGMCMVITQASPQKVVIGYEDGRVILWDLNSGKELSHLGLYTDSVMAMCYNHSMNFGIAGSVTDKLKLFKIDHNENKLCLLDKEIELTNSGVNCLEIRKDGKLFATGGWDNQTRLFGCKKYKPLAVLSFHSQSIQSLAFAEDNTLAVGSKDGAVSVWSLYK